jgi:hypothetical protein
MLAGDELVNLATLLWGDVDIACGLGSERHCALARMITALEAGVAVGRGSRLRRLRRGASLASLSLVALARTLPLEAPFL